MLRPGDQIESTESFICGIINMVTASLLAVMVVITLVGWLSFITVLTPKVPEGVRMIAARVIWAYVAAGDLLRKEFANVEI